MCLFLWLFWVKFGSDNNKAMRYVCIIFMTTVWERWLIEELWADMNEFKTIKALKILENSAKFPQKSSSTFSLKTRGKKLFFFIFSWHNKHHRTWWCWWLLYVLVNNLLNHVYYSHKTFHGIYDKNFQFSYSFASSHTIFDAHNHQPAYSQYTRWREVEMEMGKRGTLCVCYLYEVWGD